MTKITNIMHLYKNIAALLLDYNIILLCVEYICNVYVLRNQNVQMQIFCARH